jgi:hypothetical protein
MLSVIEAHHARHDSGPRGTSRLGGGLHSRIMASQRAADENRVKIGNLVASSIVLLWGGAVLLFALLHSNGARGGSAYQTGQVVGLVFAVALVFAGCRGIRNELRKR